MKLATKFIRHYPPHLRHVATQCILLHAVLYNNNRVLHYLLLGRCNNSTHNLRKLPHDRILYQTKLDIQNVLLMWVF